MAQGRVFYARYAGDFIVGTQLMDLETRGAYSLVIDLLNDRDRPIPDDPKFMSRFLNITQQRWRKIRSVLIREGKIYIDAQGCITNPRFERELARRRVRTICANCCFARSALKIWSKQNRSVA